MDKQPSNSLIPPVFQYDGCWLKANNQDSWTDN